MTQLRRQYLASDFGQTHWTMLENEDAEHPPLLCLHPIPYSGAYFSTLMPLITHRDVLAPDFPHYGASDGPGRVCSVAEYAAALDSGLQPFSAVDVLGFHTGCLVAAELALRNSNIRRMILIDVPFFTPEQQAAISIDDQVVTPTLDCLAAPWNFSVERNLPAGIELQRAYQLFVEQIRSGQKEKWGFKTAFQYPCVERFGQVKVPVRVIATKSGLREPTMACAAAIPGAELVQRDDIEFAVFELHAADIAAEVDSFLTG